MKKSNFHYPITLLAACLLMLHVSFAQSMGKVVINEYMSWTSNGCGTTAEFVELLNFGPGPVNIGCYILTTGKYTITIPSNTTLQPGEFYVIAGQNYIPGSCANIDSSSGGVTADLNWNTCNCTNMPIPTTGAGMMNDGGSANTPLVLLDPSLKIVDAVVRSLPSEAVSTVTSSSVAGNCTAKTFNIGTMGIVYEELGMSAGRGNSFARTIDGDCNWVKDPQQSANATNTRGGDVTDISYDFSIINATSCDEMKGSISIYVKHSNYAAVFPMTYTISLDANNNGIFDENDQYTTVVDDTEPFIEIDDLPVGHFKVTVGSVKGCYLKSFEFNILHCFSTLPVELAYFQYAGERNGQHRLQWLLHHVENLQTIEVQKAAPGSAFEADKIIWATNDMKGEKFFTSGVPSASPYIHFRLKITTRDGRQFFSPVLSMQGASSFSINKIWPNPATDKLNIDLGAGTSGRLTYTVFNANGISVASGTVQNTVGQTTFTIPLPLFQPGIYQLQVSDKSGKSNPISFRFVKH